MGIHHPSSGFWGNTGLAGEHLWRVMRTLIELVGPNVQPYEIGLPIILSQNPASSRLRLSSSGAGRMPCGQADHILQLHSLAIEVGTHKELIMTASLSSILPEPDTPQGSKRQ